MPALVSVSEEVISGSRLIYQERKDLRFSVQSRTPTEMKQEAKKLLRERGLVVISLNFTDKTARKMQAIVKQPRPVSTKQTAVPVFKGEPLSPRRR